MKITLNAMAAILLAAGVTMVFLKVDGLWNAALSNAPPLITDKTKNLSEADVKRGAVTELGAILWPRGTVGCTSGTTNLTFADGIVKFKGPLERAFQNFTGPMNSRGIPHGIVITMGEETCRVRITIEAVRDN